MLKVDLEQILIRFSAPIVFFGGATITGCAVKSSYEKWHLFREMKNAKIKDSTGLIQHVIEANIKGGHKRTEGLPIFMLPFDYVIAILDIAREN